MIKRHQKLVVWRRSMELVEHIYQLTKEMPKDEKFGLTSQMRRCCISIPSNIAEGASRHSDREFLRFLNIAKGSLAELETQLLLCIRLYKLDWDFSISLKLIEDVFALNESLRNRISRSLKT